MMSPSKIIGIFIGVAILHFHGIHCQDSSILPDSILTTIEGNCAEQFLLDNSICCESIEQEPTRYFCPRQCSSGICVCVNRTTGEALDGIPSFPETDFIFFNCLTVFPTEPATTIMPTTEAAQTTDPEATTVVTTTETTTTGAPTGATTTGAPTGATTTGAPTGATTTGTPTGAITTGTPTGAITTGAPTAATTDEEPTKDRCDDSSVDEDSSSSDTKKYGCSDSSASSGSSKRCKTVTRILRGGCLPSCLRLDRRKCPVCDANCQVSKELPNKCSCRHSQQVCVRGGIFGLYKCVDRPSVGDTCRIEDQDEEDDKMSRLMKSSVYRRFRRIRRRIVGLKERIQYGIVDEAEVECQNGSVCVAGANGKAMCQEENSDSICVQARMQDPMTSCTSDGEFEQLQCQIRAGATFCRCVQPEDGSLLPGTTEVIVEEIEDIPNCEILTFNNCTIEVGGLVTGAFHGDSLVDPGNCSRCTCDNGTLVDCRISGKCERISRNPRGCTYRNRVIQHRQRFEVGCGTCGCYNGHMRCSRKRCRDVRDECASCSKKGFSPVCSSNGITYPTRCHAVFCEGQIPFKLSPGRCTDEDVCSKFPCSGNETCVKKGGVSCISDCKAEDLRVCVDVNTLSCPNMEANETKLCATNGITYHSLCRLLQDSKQESVAYVGECDSEECSTGQVCGSDGETYDNICALRSRGSNVRLDYFGECLNEEGVSTEETCDEVEERQLCKFNSNNCKSLIQPADGCCPVCGGVVTIAVDISGLREYIRVNPVASKFDDLLQHLIESDVFPANTTRRCDVEFTIVNRNIQLVLSPRIPDDESFCQEEGMRIAEVLNNPKAHVIFLPDVMQFASATVASTPQVTNEPKSDDNTSSSSSTSPTALIALFMFTAVSLTKI